MKLWQFISGVGCFYVTIIIGTILLNLALLAGAVWVVVKILQSMNVI